MGLLDDAIREHLELKRRLGADDSELKQLEDEAFGQHERPPATGSLAPAPPAAAAPSHADTASTSSFDEIFDPPAKGEVPKAPDVPEPEVPEFSRSVPPAPAPPAKPEPPAPEVPDFLREAEAAADAAAEPTPVAPPVPEPEPETREQAKVEEVAPEPVVPETSAPEAAAEPEPGGPPTETQEEPIPSSVFEPPTPMPAEPAVEPAAVEPEPEPEPEVETQPEPEPEPEPQPGPPAPESELSPFDTAERIAISQEETRAHDIVRDPALEPESEEASTASPAYTPFEPPTDEGAEVADEDDSAFPDTDEEEAFEFEYTTDEEPVFGGLFDRDDKDDEEGEAAEPQPPTPAAASDFPDTGEEDELASAALLETAEHLFPSTQTHEFVEIADDVEEGDEDVVEYEAESDEYVVVEDEEPATGEESTVTDVEDDDDLDTPDFLKTGEEEDLWFDRGKPRDFDF